jgi:hypothetical protein
MIPNPEGGDVAASATAHPPAIDDLERMLRENLDDIVAEYLPQARRHGVDEAQIRAWLTNEGLPDGQRLCRASEAADLYGVQIVTIRQWVWAYNTAVRDDKPLTSSCFIPPDVSIGLKVRLWDRARLILFGWRSGRLVPGTLIPMRRKPSGANPAV